MCEASGVHRVFAQNEQTQCGVRELYQPAHHPYVMHLRCAQVHSVAGLVCLARSAAAAQCIHADHNWITWPNAKAS